MKYRDLLEPIFLIILWQNNGMYKLFRQVIVWQILIPCIILGIIFLLATLIQMFIFHSPSSFVLFVVKMMLGGFVSDILMVRWIKPAILKTDTDEYTYNIVVPNWITKHIHLKWILVVLIGLAYSIIIGLIISWIGEEDALPNVLSDKDIKLVFIVGLIVVPIVETLVHQFIIIEAVKSLTQRIVGSDYLVFSGIISALIFSLVHNYSTLYVVYAFFLGLYFSFSYIYVNIHYNSRLLAILCTSLLHFLINTFPFLSIVLDTIE